MLIGSSRSLSNFSGIMTPNAVPNWSKTLDTEVASLNKLFGIRPYFTFFDDRPENAFATEERLNPDYPDGTVLLGKNLMNDIYENYKIDAEFIIIGILAQVGSYKANEIKIFARLDSTR